VNKLFKEILNELVTVLKGKTLDTLIPPIIFIVSLNFLNLNLSLLSALSFSLLIYIFRLIKKETGKYALFGMVGILFASVFAYINQNATNYFISDMISNVLIVVVSVVSLIIKRPLAAYASHLTRGWPVAWFLRDDVKPAYKEVTIFWAIVFFIRAIVEFRLYLDDNISALFLLNTLVGFPLLIVVLTISYIYGIWRLRNLKGPGVDEFISKKEPPYRGQTKGF
jgi:hypothetical protein